MPGAMRVVPISTVVADLAAAESQATELIRGLSPAQANWQPHGRSWSIFQCLTHLARINGIYTAALSDAVAKSLHGVHVRESISIKPGWFGAWFIRSLEPPVRTRMKAPRTALPPTESGDPQVALAEFIASHKPVRGIIESSSRTDVNKLRFRNPFISVVRFTVGTGLLIINAHDRRHLWQANQVKLAPGFPQQ
jgi:hypothetical protein